MRNVFKKRTNQECRVTITEIIQCIKAKLVKIILLFLVVVLGIMVMRYIQWNNSGHASGEAASSASGYLVKVKELENQLNEYQVYKNNAYIMNIDTENIVKHNFVFQLVEIHEEAYTLAAWNACKLSLEDLLYENIQEKTDIELSKEEFLDYFCVVYEDSSQTMKISFPTDESDRGNDIAKVIKEFLGNYCKERGQVLAGCAFVLLDEYQSICTDTALKEYQKSINTRIIDIKNQRDVAMSKLTIEEKEALTGEKMSTPRLLEHWVVDLGIALVIGLAFCVIYVIHLLEKRNLE